MHKIPQISTLCQFSTEKPWWKASWKLSRRQRPAISSIM